MPKELKRFLESLSDEDAEAIWTWLDEVYSHETIHKIVEIISDSHKELTLKLCGNIEEDKLRKAYEIYP